MANTRLLSHLLHLLLVLYYVKFLKTLSIFTSQGCATGGRGLPWPTSATPLAGLAPNLRPCKDPLKLGLLRGGSPRVPTRLFSAGRLEGGMHAPLLLSRNCKSAIPRVLSGNTSNTKVRLRLNSTRRRSWAALLLNDVCQFPGVLRQVIPQPRRQRVCHWCLRSVPMILHPVLAHANLAIPKPLRAEMQSAAIPLRAISRVLASLCRVVVIPAERLAAGKFPRGWGWPRTPVTFGSCQPATCSLHPPCASASAPSSYLKSVSLWSVLLHSVDRNGAQGAQRESFRT